VEDLSKYGLPREAMQALRSKLDQITRWEPTVLKSSSPQTMKIFVFLLYINGLGLYK
jgi:hypothetical protein